MADHFEIGLAEDMDEEMTEPTGEVDLRSVDLRFMKYEDALSFLADKYGNWIKDDPELLAVYWRPGTLFKHIRLDRDEEGRITGQLDSNIVIAGPSEDDEPVGIRIETCEHSAVFAKAKKLVNADDAFFVVPLHSETMAARVARKIESTVFYVHPDFQEVGVARLSCDIFDENDFYELLDAADCKGNGISAEQWEKAKALGQSLREDGAIIDPQSPALGSGEERGELMYGVEPATEALLKNGHYTYSDFESGTIGGDVGKLGEWFGRKTGLADRGQQQMLQRVRNHVVAPENKQRIFDDPEEAKWFANQQRRSAEM